MCTIETDGNKQRSRVGGEKKDSDLQGRREEAN